MFNPFKKKDEADIKINDKIWMTQEAKLNGCAERLLSEPQTIFIAWFEETMESLQQVFFKKDIRNFDLVLAREINFTHIENKKPVFVEHHPLRNKEYQLYSRLRLRNALVFSALDEPLLMHFGGEKIMEMMKQLGMEESHSVGNKMVSRAIANAQDKLEKKVTIEQPARSQSDWLKQNIP